MSVEKMIFLLSLTYGVHSLACPSYGCSNNVTSCFQVVNSTYDQVSPCPADQVCNSASGTCGTYTPTKSGLPAGVGCNSTFTCQVQCVAGVCIGNPVGSSCTMTSECDEYSYCSVNKTCTELISVGEMCTAADQCIQGSDCLNGTCTYLLSLAPGAIGNGTCYAGTNHFCESTQCHQLNSTSFVCIEPYITNSELNPAPCVTDDDCIAFSGTYNVTGTCMCAQSPNQNVSYCLNQLGDYWGLKYLSKLTKWYNSFAITLCNVQAPTNLCMLQQWDKNDYYKFLYYSYLTQYQYLVANAQECTLLVLQPYYIYLRESIWPGQYTNVTCPSYQTVGKVSDDCVQSASPTSYSLYNCPSGSYCDLSYGSCKAEYYHKRNLGAGSFCNTTFECNGKCVTGTCQGIATGGECYDSIQCSQSTYCDISSTCQPLIQVGGVCEDYDDVCVQGSGCFEGICTKFFSIPNGVSIPYEYCDHKLNASLFCESAQCYRSDVSDPVCVAPFVTTGGSPVSCRRGFDCVATSGNYSINSNCQCSLSSTSNSSYCQVQLGDQWGQKFINKLKDWFSSGLAGNCNAVTDMELCMLANWNRTNYFEFLLYEYMFVNLPLITGADNKTLEILAPGYLYLLENQNNPNPPKPHHGFGGSLVISALLALAYIG